MAKIELTSGHIGIMLIIEMAKIELTGGHIGYILDIYIYIKYIYIYIERERERERVFVYFCNNFKFALYTEDFLF